MEERNGGLAQLGERLPCKQEVSGSIPLISTRKDKEGQRTERAGSKAGSWQQSGGLLQPAWLFRRKAIPLISTK